MPLSPVNERYHAYLEAEYPISLTRGRYMPYLLVAIASVVLMFAARSHRLVAFAAVNLFVFLIATRGIIGLKKQYDKESKIAAAWIPVLTALVQANRALFRPGLLDLPCQVLFSFDRTIGYDFLSRLAERMGALKDTTPSDPDLAAVAAMVTDETAVRYRRVKLPESFTGGPTVYAADLVVLRRYLEKGCLTHRGLPCFAEPGDTGGIELMPWHLLAAQETTESVAATP